MAAGEIVGIERQAHTPYNSNGPQQHTVFKFKVTHVVKGDIRVGDFLKVRQIGGNLPWVDGNRRGVGFMESEFPLMKAGAHYILSLLDMAEHNPRAVAEGHFTASINGIRGRSGEIGELVVLGGRRGAFDIVDGKVAFLPQRSRDGGPHPRFAVPPQIEGVPLEEALRVMGEVEAKMRQDELAREARRRKHSPPPALEAGGG